MICRHFGTDPSILPYRHCGETNCKFPLSPFRLANVQNDRLNYMLMTRHLAENLDCYRYKNYCVVGRAALPPVPPLFIDCVHAFSTNDVTAYRLLLELPVAGQRPLSSERRGFFKRH